MTKQSESRKNTLKSSIFWLFLILTFGLLIFSLARIGLAKLAIIDNYAIDSKHLQNPFTYIPFPQLPFIKKEKNNEQFVKKNSESEKDEKPLWYPSRDRKEFPTLKTRPTAASRVLGAAPACPTAGIWTGDGECYQSGFPTCQTGSNISGIQCDGLHANSCLTDPRCIRSGFCFFDPISEECQEPSCFGVCGDDAFIWDPETLDCGCNTGPFVNNRHAEKRCLDLGGSVFTTSGGVKICKFNRSTCSEGDSNFQGWAQFNSWSGTLAKTCTASTSCGLSQSCTTGSHAWADTGQESCAYGTSAVWNGLECTVTSTTCLSSITQVGCTSTSDCVAAGGEEVQDGETTFCRFSGSVCPSDWTPYGTWSTTSSQSCTGSSCITPTTCTTGSHTFSDNPARETCDYLQGAVWNGLECTSTKTTCTADVSQIGCY